MLGFKQFLRIEEGWSRPNKFPELGDILATIQQTTPKRKVRVGLFWERHFNTLRKDDGSYRVALNAIYRLGYLGKPLPPNHGSGFGRPEKGYKFKNRTHYHVHLAKRFKYSLCWRIDNDDGITFDLVSHKQYDNYLNSSHIGIDIDLSSV